MVNKLDALLDEWDKRQREGTLPGSSHQTRVNNWYMEYGDVVVPCPGCDEEYILDHKISDSGIVRPALECWSCGFSDVVQLAGWARTKLHVV